MCVKPFIACAQVFGLCAAALAADLSADTNRLERLLRQPLLDVPAAGGAPELALHRALTSDLARAGAVIRATQQALSDPAGLAAWQRQTRAACLAALGDLPPRTPLNARVTATHSRDGYRIEKVLFESRPQFYVTALLFLPDPARFAPPYPGLLIPCGHSGEGKALPGYQRGGVLAAANGMAALIYDPLDQGERLQGLGKGGVHGHNITGAKAALLGWNTATFRVWDGFRALDYLAGRPEVDASRLGCLGNSGGGTLTAYLSALDDRLLAAAPSCYISSLQHVCAAIGPQDAEQNLFGQLGFGLEHAGWLLLRAPRPTCVCAATRDFFPIAGTHQTFAEVRGVYERLQAADRLALVEHDGTHGWAEPLRVASIRFMARWLGGAADLRLPPESEMGLPPAEANVTPEGQVLRLEGARSVYDLLRDEAARLAAARPRQDAAALRAAVRRRAVIRPLDALPHPPTLNLRTSQEGGVTVREVALLSANGVPLPATFLTPAARRAPPVLLADGRGRGCTAARVAAALAEGRAVLAVDLSGCGETDGAAHTFYGASNRDEGPAVMAYLLGRSLVGIRAEDLLQCARWLATACGEPRVELHAAERSVIPALHTAVAEPELFAALRLADEPTPWESAVTDNAPLRFADIVHGALQDYSSADLKRLLP